MSELELVRGEVLPALPELAEVANREHSLFEDGLRRSVAHAIAAGEALRQAKAQMDHGQWLPWLKDNFAGSRQTAQRYLRVDANSHRVGHLDSSGLSLRALDKRIARINREEKAEQRRAEPVERIAKIGGIEIRHGDLLEGLSDVTAADAIITDPPYPREYLHEFDALGDLAASILKPDGILAVMVGQTHLPDYIERLARHVPYRWCGAYLTEGPATRIHGRKVGTKWKPVLIFGKSSRFLTQDVFASRADDKQHHHWGQSESGMADIVERLTEPGELVVDPFMGGGTTGLVCRDLGRRFIGCDVDADAVQTTRERLAA